MRLTGQATQKDKLGLLLRPAVRLHRLFADLGGGGCRGCRRRLGGARRRVQLAGEHHDLRRQRRAQRVVQATWTRPQTSRMLLEAGYSTYISRWGWMEPPGGTDEPDAGHTGKAHARARPPTPCAAAEPTGTLVPLRELHLPGPRQLLRQQAEPAQLARERLVRHGRPQHEVRVPGQLLHRGDARRGERYAADLHDQRRAHVGGQPERDGQRRVSDCAVGDEQPHDVARLLRAGPVDDRAGSRCRVRSGTTAPGAGSRPSTTGRREASRFNAAPITFPRS